MRRRGISPGFRRPSLSFSCICGLFLLICSCSVPRTSAEEETDFEFEDNLQVKRDGENASVSVPPSSSLGKGNGTEDETLMMMMMMDDPGSGPDGEDEMSGFSPLPTTAKAASPKTSIRVPTRATARPPGPGASTTAVMVSGETELFRITINFTSVNYNVALGNRSSSDFLQLAARVKYIVEKEYETTPGEQSATVLQFRPGSLDPEAEPSVIATIDFATRDFYNDLALFNVLNSAIHRGTLGTMTVSPRGFTFRPISGNGVVCPTVIGREPTSLPRREELTKANLMLDNRFICDGFLIEVSYFRGSPDGSFYVGVWKQDSENSFILRHRIEIPPAPIGIHRVELPEPLPVERGDFLGIHYPRSTSEGVIVHSIPGDGVIPSQEMFQTLVIDVFDEDLPADRTINMERFSKQVESKTFALLGVLSVASPPGSRCSSDEFQCHSGQCVEAVKKCNRYRDCDDGSDETDCACKVGQFHCDNGWCIEAQHVCDGRNDCGDRSDERNCTAATTSSAPLCPVNEFSCGDGHCIGRHLVCNRAYNCPDGSDELDCPPSECLAGREFRCADGTCVDVGLRCDDHYDCPDESDEEDCATEPTDTPRTGCDARTEFTCGDGACIDISGYCDRTKYDCRDGSDEIDCVTPPPLNCGSHEFNCTDGSCIAIGLICNRQYDCPDGSDEFRSLCDRTTLRPPGPQCDPDTEFTCGDGMCVDISGRCDRTKYDCVDGTDEYDCENYTRATSPPPRDCDSSQFTCRDGSCISNHLICDRRHDCSDGSDEFDCPQLTPEPPESTCDPDTEFTCGDGTCVDISGRCDRTKYDCADGTDEFDCVETTHPTRPTCDPRTEFTCGDRTCVDISGRCDRTKYDCVDGTDEFDCENFTRPSPPTRAPPPTRPPVHLVCDPDTEFTCGDGTCVDISGRCDRTKYDCADGTDEFECDRRTTLRPGPQCDPDTEFRCGDGTCVDISGKCDRTKYDCVDGTDEFNCVTPGPPEHTCDSRAEFLCEDGSCVDIASHCDGRYDCRDGSDELGCAPTRGPPRPTCDPDTEFTCGDGTCVAKRDRCDRTKYDCADGTDEFDCDEEPTSPPPRPTCDDLFEFTCRDGHCIDVELQCDGAVDCPDQSDEDDCETDTPRPTCDPRTEFTCRDGTCVDINGRCDRTKYDCADGTDEFDCIETTVTPRPTCDRWHEFTCGDGSCVDIANHCDGHFDCRDGSDELGCVAPTREPPGPTCHPRTEFTCGDGTCVDISGRCDRTKYDCADGTDEFDCEGYSPAPTYCEPNQEFTCGDGTCVAIETKCDGRFNCPDGSDEHGCATREPPRPTCDRRTEFTCKDGTCVDINGRCDRTKYDCADGTDEFDCEDYTERPPRWCETNQEFTCADGSCVNIERKCDGRFDCPDRSDEHGCATEPPEPTCDRWHEFTCGDDGSCIDIENHCDGHYDCRDGSDELGCVIPTLRPTCDPRTEFTCGDGTCVDISGRCDRTKYDCADGTDELDCKDYTERPRWCETNQEFTCADGSCVNIERKCDGRFDCPDRSDEHGCATREPPKPLCDPRTEFTCGDGTCVDISGRCDRTKYDCADGTDEFHCENVTVAPPRCDAFQFMCNDGSCVYLEQECDGTYDCTDGSDEDDCEVDVTVDASPSRLRQRVGSEAVFTCFIYGSTRARPHWSRRGGDLPSHARVENSRLVISPLVVEDTGEYHCTVVGVPGVRPAVVTLTVEDIYGPTTTRRPVVPGRCGPDESACGDRTCVPKDYFCDGDYDCLDRSDELNCLPKTSCEPNEFLCGSGKCILKIWRCDGDTDCPDASDERNCDLASSGTRCGANEFSCSTVHQCIPAAYQCDEQVDCQDRSDEKGCVPPTVITPPPREIHTGIGETITIVCEAIGVPRPLIVWRLNWGHTGAPPRVTSRTDIITDSGRGITVSRGVITIRNASKEDEGAYTCEALNAKGSILFEPDTIVHVQPPRGVCQVPFFNSGAHSKSDCVDCFCFGLTQDCTSSNLYLSEFATSRQMSMVDLRSRTKMEINGDVIEYDDTRQNFVIRDYARAMSGNNFYWSLPTGFLGNKVTSYGGKLTYTIYYETRRSSRALEPGPDVFLYGNDISLYHSEFVRPFAGIEQTPEVLLRESAWTLDEDGRLPASRSDLMMALEHLEYIFIKSNYERNQGEVRLGKISMTTAVPQDVRKGRAVLVEQCKCPPGYTGTSCEQCLPGFSRKKTGRYLGQCVACDCNGRSEDCDPETGACRGCRDNTHGSRCDQCIPGFYATDRRGSVHCERCPCPPIDDSGSAGKCTVSFGDVSCVECPLGYSGKLCRPVGVGVSCDPRGSTGFPSPSGDCNCKQLTRGRQCNECREGSFHLSESAAQGCLPCFCMGVTRSCTSTTRRRSQVRLLPFSQESPGIVLTDFSRRAQYTQGLTEDARTQEVSFRHLEDLRLDEYYWQLPSRFLGNKISSYGGYLRYNASSKYSDRYDVPPYTSYADVVIGGNGFELLHTRTGHSRESAQVQFSEQHWSHRRGGGPASRNDLMIALSNLDYILIKAQYIDGADEASIRDIGLDTAETRVTGALERAYEVEECACPEGYTGLSCESCGPGFWRSGSVPPHSRCERCDCHHHSETCDSITGRCTNCQHNTEGDHCDVCVRGYYGDATRGGPTDCLPCPCPLTQSPNQFSPTCILAADDRVTCTACPTGHTGRICESCLPGYAGNPSYPGDYCKPDGGRPDVSDSDCECDESGSVPNTQCDLQRSQCQCKAYVQGRDCRECQEGYFHLSAANPQGCLSCYCMGLTRECTSSAYFRSQLEPDYTSSHGFLLTTRRLGEQTTEGITASLFGKEIEYDDLPLIQKERESLFWFLPSKFTGNQVASYGGRLKFQLLYELATRDGAMYQDADVELISGENRFYLFFQPAPVPEEINSYDILLTEASFRQLDGANPTRDSFLKTLASLDAILIRATHYSHMSSVSLSQLVMDTAVATSSGWFWAKQVLAPEVEQCSCPPGYTGLSCEQCDVGFSRVSDPSLPLGRCVKCSCNNHASDCDLSTGACLDCQHHTAGDRCERCESGFYGDPARGTSADCKPCPCPLTTRENQFSATCFLDADGLPTCDQCPTGYAGRQCDRCAPTYVGDPSVPGESCVRLSVGEKPQLSVSPKRLSTAVGGDAAFQCSVEGGSSYDTRVQWIRADGRPLSARATTTDNNTLVLRKVESTDEGRYICTAINRYGKSQEEVGLTVSAERRLQVIVHEPKTLPIQAGDTVMFNCTGYSQYTYTLAWSRQDGQILQARVVDNGEGLLTIRNAQSSDSGTYICTGSNVFSIARDEAILEVNVQDSRPVVNIEPRFVRAETGESVEFLCIASGHPVPRIQWTAGPGRRMPYDAVLENNVLRFQSVSSAQHAGEYYCTAYNALGTDRATAVLEVLRETTMASFEVVLSEQELRVLPGDEARISCSARGNQAIVRHVNWTRESGPLPSGAYQENGRLVIPVCRPSDSGTYVCTIYLVNGERQVAYSTLVIEADEFDDRPPQSRTDPDRQTVQQGTTASIQCLVTGAPASTVRWSRTRGRLGPNHRVDGNVLTITDVGPDDRGLYVCEAENRFGRTTASAVLDVEQQEAPVVEIYPSGASTTVDVGSSVLFQCHATQGVPAPTISWHRADGQPLGHTVKIQGGGRLEFVEVTGQEQGAYICTGSNSAGTSQALTTLHIRGSSLKLSLVPSTQTLRPGDLLRLTCSVRGAPQLRVAWSKVQNQLSPFATTSHRGTLEILSVAANDAGQYRCEVTDEEGRTHEAFAEVNIRVPPGAFIMPRSMTAFTGQSVNFSCDVTGSPPPRIQWMKEDGGLPSKHRTQAGKLLLFDVQPHDTGRYICVVTNEVGTTRDYAQLRVHPGENGNGQEVKDKQQVVRLGDRVEILCEVVGNGNTRVTWVRTDGPLPSTAVVRDKLLILPRVELSDQGTYRCLASNAAATVFAHVTIIVAGPPTVTILKQSKDISVGSNVTITCQAGGSPVPTISWSKREGRLPRGHAIRNNTLYLVNLRSEDFGDYVCAASNSFGVERGVMTLLPSELVPYFAQSPLSYLAYPGIRDAYTNIDFEISFKPSREDGLILYNGQSQGSGDFVLFGMRDQAAEFRFDAGAGPVIIASEPLILDTWHTARAKKHGKDALLVVDGKEYRTQMVGRFIGLDLAQDLYLGGVPDFRIVSRAAKFDSNFVGCISRLVIGGVNTQIGDAIKSVGVGDCPACQNRPCRHGGSCRPAATKTGFQCKCAEGYSGQHCELVGTKCRQDTCGSYGRCYNLPDDAGFKCICPVNKSGPRCEHGLSIGVPGFSGTSYIAYPTLEDALRETRIEMTFNPGSLDDAILLYDSFNELGDNDFIALIIREEHVEFRYNLGSGPAIIKSSERLTVGEWTTVVAEISLQEGSLALNNGRPVKGQSLGTTVGLNLKSLLYIGGVDLQNIRLAPDVAVDAGFRGCISQLKVKGREVDMMLDAIESAAIGNCTELRSESVCSRLEPCQNGATCRDHGDTYECICPRGFTGDTCDNSLPMTSAQFTAASSYVELPPRLLVHSGVREEVIRMTVSTTSESGVLLYQGQAPPPPSRGKDFIALSLEGGYVVFSYELGSGPARIVSDYPIDDGLPHEVVAKRTGKEGSLTVDDEAEVSGESGGRMTGLEVNGVIYLGGPPDIRTKTRGKLGSEFSGCISNVFFQSRGPLDFTKDTAKSVNVSPCQS